MTNRKPLNLGSEWVFSKTDRGFDLAEFKDFNDVACSLQQSSLAITNPPGSSAIWLGVDGQRMHLTLPMVEALVGLLQHWVDECELCGEGRGLE